ncbi:hypothetical protein IEO21_09639 [Rhodonia placenta]|uniref:Uncharacterized protein n=1 Tax=Rhodonia placenta TaxID=104341 RepID=A0A8H7TY22_9APHY|nr:hypothetical protein IEO21_09639 [Postia placenta]
MSGWTRPVVRCKTTRPPRNFVCCKAGRCRPGR